MNLHPTRCGGPGICGYCDAIIAHREDTSPTPVAPVVLRHEAAARAERDPANGPQCAVTWRDGWGCTGDETGLHACHKYGPHTVHTCDSQSITDAELAEGRKPGDLPAWAVAG